MARELAITAPDGKTRTIRLESGHLSLGRSSVNELCYPDDVGLSRQHMALERDGEEWFVRDLGSKNGTFVNGQRIADRNRLKAGDRISASRVLLVFDPSAAGPAPTIFIEQPQPAGPSSVTVSTTLESLLRGETKDPKSVFGAAAVQWASPVTALVRAGRELAARRPLPELFRVILDLAIEAVGSRRGVLMTSEKGKLMPQATRGEGMRISTAVRDRVLAGNSLLVRDVQQDEALRQRNSIVEQSVHSLIAVPLQTDNQVIGLIYVDSPHFGRQFGSDDLNLLTVMANVAAIRIERERLAEVEQAEKLMAAELEQAAEIQRQFLPAGAPSIPGLDVAGYNAACHTVGGDYYDFLKYPDGRVALVIGDVAGKGMPAALLMACLQSKVQALAESGADPATVVERLNRQLCSTVPRNRFITFFLAVVDPASGEMAYCNAGHNPPLVVGRNGDVRQLEGGGPVLGVLPKIHYENQQERLQPGEVLVLYSDGVTEACNEMGEEFEPCLPEVVKRVQAESASTIVTTVTDAVRDWIAGQPPADDITLVAARRL